MAEAFMGCEAGARANIRPSEGPSSLGKRPRNLARSPLTVAVSRRKKSGRRQKSAFSLIPPWSSPLILAFDSRYRTRAKHSLDSSTIELLSILAESGAYSPNSTCSNTLTRSSAPYETFRESITCLSRATRSRRTPYWRSGGAHLAKPS